MKRRMGIIMPRLIGATIVVGIAAFVITTLFKLLLGITLLAGAVMLISRKAFRRRQYMMPAGYGPQNSFDEYGYTNAMRGNDAWANQSSSFGRPAPQKEPTIVPIN
jgi:predicted lipid-binding transport protein (Tim44 family)